MKRLLYVLMAGLLFGSRAGAQSDLSAPETTFPHCQILDEAADPLYRVNLSFVSEERFEGYGETAFLELAGDWELAYFHDVLWGDIDVHPRAWTTILLDSAGIQLPDQVVGLSLDTGWTIRTMGGTAIQARLQPGMYSDFEELTSGAFFLPFSLALIQSFNDQLSGIVGFDVRPGFDREFIPRAGLAWKPGNGLRIEAGIPESRVDWAVDRLWNLHAGFQWANSSYDLREKGDYNRGQITFEDYRVYVGFSRAVTGNVRFTCDVGTVFERSVSFEREAAGLASDIDIASGMFVGFGMVGPF